MFALFPDGSHCALGTDELMQFAASRVAVLDISPHLHLTRQVLPLVTHAPELLGEIANAMPWEAFLGAVHAMDCRSEQGQLQRMHAAGLQYRVDEAFQPQSKKVNICHG